jgi:hypothetical protein
MQFGHSLQRILQHLVYCNPTFRPPLMTKIDLADGYSRVLLSQQAALELAVVLPPEGLSEPLLVLPLSLPMGWSQSLPYFCTFPIRAQIWPTAPSLAPLALPTHTARSSTTPYHLSLMPTTTILQPSSCNSACHHNGPWIIRMYTSTISWSWHSCLLTYQP